MTSKKFTLNKKEVKAILKNALIFSAPALIVFLSQLQAGTPIKEAIDAFYVWGLGVALDALRKLQAGK